MQRAKDLAENAKTMMAKDKEIVQLKEKIANLEERVKNNVSATIRKVVFRPSSIFVSYRCNCAACVSFLL